MKVERRQEAHPLQQPTQHIMEQPCPAPLRKPEGETATLVELPNAAGALQDAMHAVLSLGWGNRNVKYWRGWKNAR